MKQLDIGAVVATTTLWYHIWFICLHIIRLARHIDLGNDFILDAFK
jgi:hypothetical protein